MKNKFLVGVIAVGVVMGGALAVGAANGNDDSNHFDDSKVNGGAATQTAPKVIKNVEVELETEHGQRFYKVETDDSMVAPPPSADAISIESATEIATNTVNGTITKIEKEVEHGRLEYKFEIQTGSGESEVRIDAETGEVTRIEHDDDKYDDSSSDDSGYDDKGDNRSDDSSDD